MKRGPGAEKLLPAGDDCEGGAAEPPKKKPRVYYIDWMRVIAIYLVVVYHVVQGLNWVSFYDNIPGMKKFVVSFRAAALQSGMPMFFHISGRGHALSPSMGLVKTFKRRAQRLLLPFAVCYVLLIPPWQYIDKEYDWKHPSSMHMKANPIEWLLDYYTSYEFLLYFDMAWLWFLPALYGITVLCSPLFLLAERYHKDKMFRTYYCVAVLFWGLLSLGLHACEFSLRFIFFSALGPVSAVVIARFVPVPPHKAADPPEEDAPTPMQMWNAAHVYTAIQIASTVGIVLSFSYAEIDPPRADGAHDPRAAIPFLIMCTGFYVHGYFVQRWGEGFAGVDSHNPPFWIWPYRLLKSFVVLLLTMCSTPVGDVETGHFIYPIYSVSYEGGAGFGAMYVLGTWTYLAIFLSLFQATCDNIGSKEFYKHATSSTMIVYIFHWVFIKVFAFWWLNPMLFENSIVVYSAWVALAITFVALVTAVALSLGIYALLVFKCPRLGWVFGLGG